MMKEGFNFTIGAALGSSFTNSIGGATKKINKMRSSLDNLNTMKTKIESIPKIEKNLTSLSSELSEAKQKAQNLGKTLNNPRPTQALVNRFDKAESRVSQLKEQFESNRQTLNQYQKDLRGAENRFEKISKTIAQTNVPTKAMQQEYKEASRAVDTLRKRVVKQEATFNKNAAELDRNEKKMNALREAMKKSRKPTAKMQKDYEKAVNKVNKLTNEYSQQENELKKYKRELSESGVNVNDLASEHTKLAKKIETTSSKLKRMNQINDGMKSADDRMQHYKSKMMGVVARTAAMGSVIAAGQQVRKAQGELATLGVSEKGIGQITQQAKKFTNQFAGTTAPKFIKASYDIRSGIENISEAGVAEYTKMAAMTAAATKSSVGTMTDLMATGYGIFRDQYEQMGSEVIEGFENMSQKEKDIKFGEYLSAGIAISVQKFKTDGSKISQALRNLGATATKAGYSMQDQLAVIGKLSQTMEGSEAATKFKAFIDASQEAGEKLNLNFTDANGELLRVPEILEKIKEKYGGSVDAIEKTELKKAFGTQEAVAMIDLLIGKTEELEEASLAVGKSAGKGLSVTEKMAMAAQRGKEFELLGQQIFNLGSTISKIFMPAALKIAGAIGVVTTGMQGFIDTFPTISSGLGWVVGGFVSMGIIVPTVGFAMAALASGYLRFAKVMQLVGIRLPVTRAGFKSLTSVLSIASIKTGLLTLKTKALSAATMAVTGVTKAWTVAQRLLNVAFVSSPIGWIVAGITAVAAGAYLVIKNWKSITGFFGKMWSFVKNIFTEWKRSFLSLFSPILIIDKLKTLGSLLLRFNPLKMMVDKIMGFLKGTSLYKAGAKLVGTLVSGIKSKVMAPVEGVKKMLSKVRDFLPFSDAKKGPLSDLTKSGSRIPGTLAEGVNKGEKGLASVFKKSLSMLKLPAPVANVFNENTPPSVSVNTPQTAAQQKQIHITYSPTIHYNGPASDKNSVQQGIQEALRLDKSTLKKLLSDIESDTARVSYA